MNLRRSTLALCSVALASLALAPAFVSSSLAGWLTLAPMALLPSCFAALALPRERSRRATIAVAGMGALLAVPGAWLLVATEGFTRMVAAAILLGGLCLAPLVFTSAAFAWSFADLRLDDDRLARQRSLGEAERR